MQEFSQAFVEAIKDATKEMVATRSSLARSADDSINRSILVVLGCERRFLGRTAGFVPEMKERIGRDREKTYAVLLTSKGVSEVTAAKVVAEAMIHAAKPV